MKVSRIFPMILSGMMAFGMMGGVMAASAVPAYEEVAAKMENVNGTVFPIGAYNTAYAPYFTGHTFLASITKEGVPISNVTFIDGAHTFWHKHHGTCQILVAESGHEKNRTDWSPARRSPFPKASSTGTARLPAACSSICPSWSRNSLLQNGWNRSMKHISRNWRATEPAAVRTDLRRTAAFQFHNGQNKGRFPDASAASGNLLLLYPGILP